MVQTIWLDDVVVNDFDLETTIRGRRQTLDELPQLRSTNSICTVDSDRPIEFPCAYRSLKRRSYFLVISFLGWFAIFIRCVFRVQTTGNVMELWCRKQLIVGVLRTRRLKSCEECRNEARPRSSSVTCKHHSCFDFRFDVQVTCNLVVGFQESLIGGRVCKCCSIGFP